MSDRMIYQVEETRTNILQAAEELFLENGFFETQMKDIAVHLGISRHTLYRYYRDKTDLGFAILGMIYKRLSVQFEAEIAPQGPNSSPQAAPDNARDRLIHCLVSVFTAPANATDLRFMAEFDAFFSGRRVPEDFLERLNSTLGNRPFELFQQAIQEGIEEGSIRSDIEALPLLLTCLYSIKTLHSQVISRGGALLNVSDEHMQRMVQIQAQLISDGLKPQESKR